MNPENHTLWEFATIQQVDLFIIAVFIGGIEVLSVISTETGVTAGPFGWAANVDFANLGYYIIGIFVVSWVVSMLVFKIRRVDLMDERLATAGTSTGVAPGGE